MPKLTGIKETALSVADVARSRQFYTDLLECTVMRGDERFCALEVAGTDVLLLFAKGTTQEPLTLPGGVIPGHGADGESHVGFAIPSDALEAWIARLGEKRIAIESTVDWPLGGKSIYFRDPDGHLLEFLTPGIWPMY
jgi:catechol 2,3-dioxygenase-like lactoylglutathione lyase family enzyme